MATFQVIIENHELFPDEFLSKNVVPNLIKEFGIGWHNPDHYLLRHFDTAAAFLADRRFLAGCHIECMLTFYNVTLHYLQSGLRANEPGLKLRLFKAVPSAVDIALEHGVGLKYEAEIMEAAGSAELQVEVVELLPKVSWE